MYVYIFRLCYRVILLQPLKLSIERYHMAIIDYSNSSAPIGAWEVKDENMTDRPTDRRANIGKRFTSFKCFDGSMESNFSASACLKIMTNRQPTRLTNQQTRKFL